MQFFDFRGIVHSECIPQGQARCKSSRVYFAFFINSKQNFTHIRCSSITSITKFATQSKHYYRKTQKNKNVRIFLLISNQQCNTR